MKKIFKKSLAIMVSAAICLTALIGCLSVSAATRGKGTFTVGKISGKAGASVTVPIELKYTSGGEGMGIAASLFDVSFDTDALTITDIAAGEDATYDPDVEDKPGGGNVPPQDIYTVEYRSNGETISVVDGAVRILAMPADNKAVVTSMQALLTFTINDGAEAKAYDITITEEQTCDFGIAESTEVSGAFGNFEYTGDAEFIDMTVTNGKITVVEDAPSCEHQWEFVSAVPATGSDDASNVETAKGSITFKCALCEETKTEEVNYSYYARTASYGLNAESETLIRFEARYERDFSRIVEGANITNGFIVMEQNRNDEPISNKIVNFADCTDTISATYKVYQTNIGIIGAAMSDDVTSTVYAYDSTTGKWYSGIRYTTSVKSLAGSILSTSNNDAQKTVMVNLLNYGADAQVYFNINTNNLANSDIEAYQSYATEPRAYDGPEMNLPLITENERSFYFYRYQMLAEAKITTRMYFRLPSAYSEADTPVDMSNFTVEVTYTDFQGEQVTEVITSDSFQPEGRVNRVYVDVPFRAPDLRAVVSYVVKENGVEVGPVATISFENMLAEVVASSNNQSQIDALNSLMAFSDAAYDYLGK